MCFALFIAAGSFFSIRARVARLFPEPLTTGRMRALPIVLLFGTMFYWLWRVRGRHVLTRRGRDLDEGVVQTAPSAPIGGFLGREDIH